MGTPQYRKIIKIYHCISIKYMICKTCETNKFLMILQTIDKENTTERIYECSQCGNRFKTRETEEPKKTRLQKLIEQEPKFLDFKR